MLTPGDIVAVRVCASVRNCFFVYYSPVALMDTSSIGFHTQMFWGFILQVAVAVLKVGVLDLRSKSFAIWGEAGS